MEEPENNIEEREESIEEIPRAMDEVEVPTDTMSKIENKMEEIKNKMEVNTHTPDIKKSKTRFILPIFLILIILVAVGYVGYGKHQERVAEKEVELFRTFTSSLALSIFNEAITCKPIPINNGSLEINLIAAECLTAPLS